VVGVGALSEKEAQELSVVVVGEVDLSVQMEEMEEIREVVDPMALALFLQFAAVGAEVVETIQPEETEVREQMVVPITVSMEAEVEAVG
jgi:hypothetical protein